MRLRAGLVLTADLKKDAVVRLNNAEGITALSLPPIGLFYSGSLYNLNHVDVHV